MTGYKGLIVLIIIILSVPSAYGNTPVHSPTIMNEAAAVPDEYILITKNINGNNISAADIKSSVETYFNVIVKKTFVIGRKRAFLVHGSNDQLNAFENDRLSFTQNSVYGGEALDTIQAITPNIYIKIDEYANDVCQQQNTGQNLWGLSRIGARNRNINGIYTYASNNMGSGVDVYVLDTGVYTNHAEFEGRAIWGYTAESLNEGDYDGHGHGTHVAGTIGSAAYGVAKGVNLIAVKVLSTSGAGTSSSVLEGIEWAMQRYYNRGKPNSIFSMSFGANSLGNYGGIFEEVYDAGIVSVASAMNENQNACYFTPANIEQVISVASSGPTDYISTFSNYGTCVDIVAPGEDILSTYIGYSTATRIMQGTSMAAPHVSGAIARYMSSLPYKPTPFQVKNWLLTTTTNNKLYAPFGYPKIGTPNKLLYADCTLSDYTSAPLTSTTRRTTTTTRRTTTTSRYRSACGDKFTIYITVRVWVFVIFATMVSSI